MRTTEMIVLDSGDEAGAWVTTTNKSDRKAGEGPKPIEVVFVVDGDKAKIMGLNAANLLKITSRLKSMGIRAGRRA